LFVAAPAAFADRLRGQASWRIARTARGAGAPLADTAPAYLPGDIVAWDLGGGILHVGIATDGRAPSGAPLVVHNIGAGPGEDDIPFRFTIIGHYRPPGAAAGGL
jgi:uncharacterized protein YijF (DUF1287 family)